jgi:hypothetical protein
MPMRPFRALYPSRLAVTLFLAVVIHSLPYGAAALGKDRIPQDTDLVIVKSEITSTARFYPYKAGKTYMEILAVRAPDGTIRTALNTCQICYDSGRGYYVQEGSVFVCQNCGNRFRLDQIELIKGGCNPVPIGRELKIETADTVTIPATILTQGAFLFARWKR